MFQKTTLLILSLFLTSVSAYALTDQEREKLRVRTTSSSNVQHYSNPMFDGNRLDNLYFFSIPGINSSNQAANKFCEINGHLGAYSKSMDNTVVYPTKSIGNGGVCNWPIPCKGFSNISCVTSCKPGFVNNKNSNGAYECIDRRYYKIGGADRSLSAEEPAKEVGKTKCPSGWALEFNSSNNRVVCSKDVTIPVEGSTPNSQCPIGWDLETDEFADNLDGCKYGETFRKTNCQNRNVGGTLVVRNGRDRCEIAATSKTEKRYVRVFPNSGSHPANVQGTTDRAAEEQECGLGDSEMIKRTGTSNNYAYCRKLK